MTECNWPTGAQSAGYFDGKTGRISNLGKNYLAMPFGSKGRSIYIFEYWCSFRARKDAMDACFIHYPNEKEGTK
jgi:hypothetical protein